MNAARLADLIEKLIDTYVDCGVETLGEPELDVATTQTFADTRTMTMNEGLVVMLADGSEFQVTVVQSKAAH